MGTSAKCYTNKEEAKSKQGGTHTQKIFVCELDDVCSSLASVAANCSFKKTDGKNPTPTNPNKGWAATATSPRRVKPPFCLLSIGYYTTTLPSLGKNPLSTSNLILCIRAGGVSLRRPAGCNMMKKGGENLSHLIFFFQLSPSWMRML